MCLASALRAAEAQAQEAAGAAARQAATTGASADSLVRLLAKQRASAEHDKAAALAQLRALHASEVPPLCCDVRTVLLALWGCTFQDLHPLLGFHF